MKLDMKLTFNGNEIQCDSTALGNIAALRLTEYSADPEDGMNTMPVIGNGGTICETVPTELLTEGMLVWCVNLRGRGLLALSLECAMQCVRACNKTDSAECDGQDGMN